MATPFTPRFGTGATKSITVTGSSQRVAIPDAMRGVDVRICNTDTQTVFINTGDVTVTAATTDLPIAAGSVEVLHLPSVGSGERYIAAIGTAANSKLIYFTPGSGI